jgi:hypothetical protein
LGVTQQGRVLRLIASVELCARSGKKEKKKNRDLGADDDLEN